jgi:hypothetical protein
MNKILGYLISAAFIALVVAIVFRVPAVKKIVTGS